MKRYAVLLLLPLLMAAGCSDEEEWRCTLPPISDELLPYPDTRVQVLANFQTILEEKNFDWYRHLLPDEYLMVLQEETRNAFPDLGPTIGRDEDLRIAERMFSGDDLTGPDGDFVPGVIDISFGVFQPTQEWKTVPSESAIPGDYWVPMQVEILFNRGQGYSQIACQGVLEFYVTEGDSLHAGAVRKYYQVSGIKDLTVPQKSVEEAIYGTLWALYR